MNYSSALRSAREFITAQNGVIAPLPASEEELNPAPQDDLSYRAVALETTTKTIPVPYRFPDESSCSEFAYFEDGRQRTIEIGHIPNKAGKVQVIVPVHFFVVAAVILVREQGELKVWAAPEIEKGVLVDRSLVPNQLLMAGYENQGLSVVDIKNEGGDYYDMKRRALKVAKDRRLAAETRLISRWCGSPEASSHFLVVDGTLMNLREEDNVERCVGVSKSFGSRYFDIDSHNRIMSMPEFHRSWTFRFHSEEDADDSVRQGRRERVSWYLRLRRRPNSPPEFGMVRVEISQRHVGQAASLATRFSRSLLSERLPTSYPAPRWHNHLYPVHACENYLSSIMPSLATIRAAMRG